MYGVPFLDHLRQQIEDARTRGQKREYYVRIGPVPEVVAFQIRDMFSPRHGYALPVELVEAGDSPGRKP